MKTKASKPQVLAKIGLDVIGEGCWQIIAFFPLIPP
jgi:hypothetical protein